MSAITLPVPELPRIAATVQIPNPLDEFDEFLAAPEPPRPTPKGTTSERIGKIAWWWNEQYPGHVMHRAKYELGASDAEIKVGFELGYLEADEYRRLRCWYGDPAYGSWPEEAAEERIVRATIIGLMTGRAELLDERPLPRHAIKEAA